jgi:mannose-6-phosphate isomerase-like protein (cupin superfamily)
MTAETGRVTVHTVLDTGAAAGGLVRRLAEVPAGARFEGAAGPGGELWFVIAGWGQLASGDLPVLPVQPGTGVWLPSGTSYRLSAGGPGTLRLDSVCLPAGPAAAGPDPGGAAVPLLSQLADCPVEVTGDRRFRVLFGPGNGCDAATQFVGEIPPGRAPEHSHPYDEVVLILDGEGVLHARPGGGPLTAGSCVHLPPGRPHCLENTGAATLWVLGVFHPGGSPAAKVAERPRSQ